MQILVDYEILLGLNSQEIRKIGGKITVFQFGGEPGVENQCYFEQNREFRFRELALTFVHYRCFKNVGRIALDCFLSPLKMRKTQGKLPALLRWVGTGRGELSGNLEFAGIVFAVLGFSKLNITLTSCGKREFVPRDQVSSLLVVYSSLFLLII